MNDYFRTYWPAFVFLVGTLVSLVAQWAVLGTRISAVEARQDRQSTTITSLQTQQNDQAKSNAAIQAKVDAISDNVNYIRSRIDSATR